MKILLVDDEPPILMSLENTIQNSTLNNVVIFTASDPQQALNIIQNDPPEILVTDIRMPRISGIDLAKSVIKHNLYTQIIFLTGYSDFEYAHAGIECKVFDYLLKPVSFNDLIDCIDRAYRAYEFSKYQHESSALFQKYCADSNESTQKKFLYDLIFYPHTKTKDALEAEINTVGIKISKYIFYALGITTTIRYAEDNIHYVFIVEQFFNLELKSNHEVYTFPFGDCLYLLMPINNVNEKQDFETKIHQCISVLVPVRLQTT